MQIFKKGKKPKFYFTYKKLSSSKTRVFVHDETEQIVNYRDLRIIPPKYKK